MDNIQVYIDQLSDQEKKTLKIAKEHLGTSFNIKKSIGYMEWLKKQTEEKKVT